MKSSPSRPDIRVESECCLQELSGWTMGSSKPGRRRESWGGWAKRGSLCSSWRWSRSMIGVSSSESWLKLFWGSSSKPSSKLSIGLYEGTC